VKDKADGGHDQEDGEGHQIDLCNLTPSNFNEIPYISQINVKRKSME
jgi:hypothetical protein